jgi:Histidine kinase-, DNA gyrase B-, and HSP90-like ATPase
MDIETSNAIKLFFPNPSLVQVFFEALANALDAGASEISVRVEIQSFSAPDTLKISITDNGHGFTEESFERFKRLLETQDSFHKGLGRLVFLNYFARIAVGSTWGANRRTFVFSKSFQGESEVEKLPSEQPNTTTLAFTNFIRDRLKAYDDVKPGALKARIIEHFLPTLDNRRRAHRDFTIKINLHTEESNAQKDFFSGKEVITAADLPELTSVLIKDSTLDAYEGIEMFYRVKSGMGERTQLTAASIDGRTIPIHLLQPASVPFNHSIIFLFSSKLFEGKADTSRQKLELPESISEPDLLRVLRREVGNVLADKIPQISEKNEQTKDQFEERFPHLLGYFEEATVGLIDKDEALDIAQRKFFKAQKEVLQCEKLDDATYEKSLELSSRTLTEYILYRDKIIRRMKEMTQANSGAEIHNLIAPRYEQFHQDGLVNDIYRNNAWLLDDKFMSFQTILSEAQMDSVIEAITLQDAPIKDEGRPDVTIIFSADPAEATAVDVVVVELKKITDEEKDNQFVINQLLARARKLAAHCPKVQRIWYYAVIHIDNELEESLLQQKFVPMFSKGRVFYNEFPTRRPDGTTAPTPTFVMSFDAIVADAECRNHTFLEILRHGIKQYAEKQAIPPLVQPSENPAHP